jgi:hypothetical protein
MVLMVLMVPVTPVAILITLPPALLRPPTLPLKLPPKLMLALLLALLALLVLLVLLVLLALLGPKAASPSAFAAGAAGAESRRRRYLRCRNWWGGSNGYIYTYIVFDGSI